MNWHIEFLPFWFLFSVFPKLMSILLNAINRIDKSPDRNKFLSYTIDGFCPWQCSYTLTPTVLEFEDEAPGRYLSLRESINVMSLL